MKKEVAEKLFNEKGITYIPQYKKIWLSMTKFEKYPEMAAEGVARAFGYLALLIFIFSLILGIFLTYETINLINTCVDFLEENFSVIEYKDGSLSLELENGENSIITDMGTIIIDTSDVDEETLAEYEDIVDSSDLGIIWLKDYASVSGINYEAIDITYEEVFDQWNIEELDKAGLIELIEEKFMSNSSYFTYFIMAFMYSFIIYFIETLCYVIMLAIFGMLTALIARLRMRFRAVFNMSIYAMTLSIILQLIYIIVYGITNFEIKYFDIMYTAIAYICLAAAIFMIKSDVVKQQIEMIKIVNKKEENQEQKEDEKEEEKEEEEKENSSDENKEERKQKKEQEDGKVDENPEGQGSNA